MDRTRGEVINRQEATQDNECVSTAHKVIHPLARLRERTRCLSMKSCRGRAGSVEMRSAYHRLRAERVKSPTQQKMPLVATSLRRPKMKAATLQRAPPQSVKNSMQHMFLVRHRAAASSMSEINPLRVRNRPAPTPTVRCNAHASPMPPISACALIVHLWQICVRSTPRWYERQLRAYSRSIRVILSQLARQRLSR